jgi:prepilin-type processing-associated H-X9-DG protein
MDDKIVFAFADGHAKNYPVDQAMMRTATWPGQGYDEHWPRGWYYLTVNNHVDGCAYADLDP